LEKVEKNMYIKDFIKRHEGLRLRPYRCTAGKLTIGWGHNLDDRGITIPEAERMLDGDIAIAAQDLYKVFGSMVLQFNDDRHMALIDMMFNLGINKFRGFKNMIKAIIINDWSLAREHALNSRWAKQVGNRAVEVTNLFINA
jgi:lysozyme